MKATGVDTNALERLSALRPRQDPHRDLMNAETRWQATCSLRNRLRDEYEKTVRRLARKFEDRELALMELAVLDEEITRLDQLAGERGSIAAVARARWLARRER